jgi:2-octaprenyl-6-methoxyphenol hydroxylase
MRFQTTDIFVSGGGIAGMAAAMAFERAGFSVICADPVAPVITRQDNRADLRTTAFLQPSQTFLQSIGIWDHLAKHAVPLEVMRIVDAGGAITPPAIRVMKEFQASDISNQPFGWNVPNWLSRKELLKSLNDAKDATFLPGVKTVKVFTRESEARVTLSDGQKIRARLIIAADGRSSYVRKNAQIGVTTKRFGQKALAFVVTHPIPHENVSTEIHRRGGPFTLVPLPDHQGTPSSAIVWMETSKHAARLIEMDRNSFETEMNARSCGILGPLTLETKRTVWPIISQLADRFSAQRIALVGEAAHAIPPIGAQGLNMSLEDIKTLVDLAIKADDIGSKSVLDAYHKARITDVRFRVGGISLLNQTSIGPSQILRDIRASGIGALHGLAPLRKTLMKMGLGVRS